MSVLLRTLQLLATATRPPPKATTFVGSGGRLDGSLLRPTHHERKCQQHDAGNQSHDPRAVEQLA
jgi:hypothetical protein